MHEKLVFAPGPSSAQVQTTLNQLQMMLATFYKKISNLQQSPQEKKIWNRGFPIIRKILKKNVDTLDIIQ